MSCGPLTIVALVRNMGSRCYVFCLIVVLVTVVNSVLIGGLLFCFHVDAYAVQSHMSDLASGGAKFIPLDQDTDDEDSDEEDDQSHRQHKSGASDGNNMDSNLENSKFLMFDETPTKSTWVG